MIDAFAPTMPTPNPRSNCTRGVVFIAPNGSHKKNSTASSRVRFADRGRGAFARHTKPPVRDSARSQPISIYYIDVNDFDAILFTIILYVYMYMYYTPIYWQLHALACRNRLMLSHRSDLSMSPNTPMQDVTRRLPAVEHPMQACTQISEV